MTAESTPLPNLRRVRQVLTGPSATVQADDDVLEVDGYQDGEPDLFFQVIVPAGLPEGLEVEIMLLVDGVNAVEIVGEPGVVLEFVGGGGTYITNSSYATMRLRIRADDHVLLTGETTDNP